jgi:hypothetical protein
MCKNANIVVSSKMKKDELVALILEALEDASRGDKKKHTPILHDDSDDEDVQVVQSVVVVEPVVVEPAEVSSSLATDYSKMTIAELKNQCKSRLIQFSAKSKKDDLIGLLAIADDNVLAIADDNQEREKTVETVADKKEKNPRGKSKKTQQPLEEEPEVQMPELAQMPVIVAQPEFQSPSSMSDDDNTQHAIANDDEVAEEDDDDEFVEKQTVLLEHNEIKYWMDTEDNSTGLHDIYDYTTLDHIGFFNKNTNTIAHIDT